MTEEWTPFLVPEFGWVFVVLVIGAAIIEMTGKPERDVREGLRSNAPFRFLLLIRLALYAATLLIGLGMLTKSRRLGYAGIWTGIPSLIGIWFIGTFYRNHDVFSSQSNEEGEDGEA